MNIEIIQSYIEQYGSIGIFLIVFLEYANFPIPSEVVLPIVGMLVSHKFISFQEAFVLSLSAGLTGSILNYFLGRYYGEPLIRGIINRQVKLKRSLESSMWWINKYGKASVMTSRIIPLARTFISIPAGVIKMPILSFMLYSAAGISIWNVALIGMGIVFAGNIEKIEFMLSRYAIAILLLTALLLSIGIYMYKKEKTRKMSKKLYTKEK